MLNNIKKYIFLLLKEKEIISNHNFFVYFTSIRLLFDQVIIYEYTVKLIFFSDCKYYPTMDIDFEKSLREEII